MISASQLLRQTSRRQLRAPGFSVAALLTLTLGIGATTAIFSVVNGVLLRPLPYAGAERLVDLSHTLSIAGVAHVDQSDATFLYYRRANGVFTDIAAYRMVGVNLGGLSGAAGDRTGGAERLTAARVSASIFPVLRGRALRGRVFVERDDRPDAPPVVLLGQRLWERKYAADPRVIGQRVDVDGVSREVIGILPAGLRLPSASADVWLPLALDPANTKTAAFDYQAIARLRDGVGIEAAAADLQRLLPHVPEAFPGRLTKAAIAQIKMRAVVRPLRDVVVGDVGRALWVVFGAVGFLLLIACTNVANLFLARAEGRQHELAVRRALGAGRGAIVAEFLADGLLLSTIGGVIALAIAAAAIRVLPSLDAAIGVPRLEDVGIDGGVLAVTAGVSILAAILVSAFPALRSTDASVSSALGDDGRSAMAGRRRHRARHALVVAQMALALVLVSGAGLMARSFMRLRAVQPGFDAAHAFTFRVALPQAAYAAPGNPARFFLRALDDMAAVPGVQATGVVTKLPLAEDFRRDTALFVEDRPLGMGAMPRIHQVVYASPGYFKALGIPLRDGRAFDRPDPDRAPREVIVTRALAKRYWDDERAVGRRVRLAPNGPWHTIVGITGDVHETALEQPPDETIYLPLVTVPGATDSVEGPARWTPREVAFVVRTAGDPTLVATSIASVVRAIDPGVPEYDARLMADIVSRASARTSFTLYLLGIASALALTLGAIGIYGVISYVVSLRTREIAVRLALGAEPARVRRMVSRQALGVAGVGIGLGVVGAIALTRVLAALLFNVSPTDPATLLGAALLLLIVAFVASALPAYRAARMDPSRALRAS